MLSWIIFLISMGSLAFLWMKPPANLRRPKSPRFDVAQARREAYAIGTSFPEADGTLSWRSELTPPHYETGGITAEQAGTNLAAGLRTLRPGERIAPTMNLTEYLSYVRHNVAASTAPPTNIVDRAQFIDPVARTHVYFLRRGVRMAFELPAGWTAADWRMAASLVYADAGTPDARPIRLPSGMLVDYGHVRGIIEDMGI